MPPRLATYECTCCGRRVHRWLGAGNRAAESLDCNDRCSACRGTCAGRLRRTNVIVSESPIVSAAGLVE